MTTNGALQQPTRTSTLRLTKDYTDLLRSPPPYITAHPSEQNILKWYFLILGPPDTPFAGGQYMGILDFPPEYPFTPPSMKIITPTGRFVPGELICTTFSNFHPETWNCSWHVSTILNGLLSFMTEPNCESGHAAGAIHPSQTSIDLQIQLALNSKQWNSSESFDFRVEFPAEHASNLGLPFNPEQAGMEVASGKGGRSRNMEVVRVSELLVSEYDDVQDQSHANDMGDMEDWEVFDGSEDDFEGCDDDTMIVEEHN